MHKIPGYILHKKFVDGDISAVEIAKYFLDRCHKLNKDIGAFITILDERVMSKAAELDEKRQKGEPLGSLAGIPIAIKDNIHIEGVKTTCASQIMENYVAPFDATVVRLIEDEDGLIIGKTNLDEFAMGSSNETSAFFPTRNPLDLDKVPGGSSGGSAAAVAAGLCCIALGSDTGGSIRQPAAFTGTYGFKPSYGLVSRYGLVSFASSLDQIGPLARCNEDIHLIMKVLASECKNDAMSYESAKEVMEEEHFITKPLKIVIPDSFPDAIDPSIIDVFNEQVARLKHDGHEIMKRSLHIFDHAVSVYYVISPAEASSNLSRYDGIGFTKRSETESISDVYKKSRNEFLGKEVKRRILLGTYVLSSDHYSSHFEKAQKARRVIVNELNNVLNDCDIIMTPCVPTLPFDIGAQMTPLQMYMQDIFAIPANLAGLPAISLPVETSTSMPTGIQCIGKQFLDALLLAQASIIKSSLTEYSLNVKD